MYSLKEIWFKSVDIHKSYHYYLWSVSYQRLMAAIDQISVQISIQIKLHHNI